MLREGEEHQLEQVSQSPSMLTEKLITSTAKNLRGYDFYRTILRSPKLIVAPMVDQSELPWRLLSRRHGAQLCYTPMFHAALFSKDEKYRKQNFSTCPEDRPLIVQFCANDPAILLSAARYVENHCDAVDLNLGCPQNIAKRGNYGSFLQDNWDLISRMVKCLHDNLSIPVTCKIRIFPDVTKTIEYAKMLEEAGCQLLTVHGRLREQRGQTTGLADWNQIKAVKESVKIPVVSNGNIQCFEDVERCLEQTGVEGVMTAEGNLHNPTIFEREKQYHVCDISEEYLALCAEFPTHISNVRAHMFKLWIKCLPFYVDLRDQLGKAKNLTEVAEVTTELRKRLKEEEEEYAINKKSDRFDEDQLPHWICQIHVRKDRLKNCKPVENSNDKEGDTEIPEPKGKKMRLES